VRTFYPFTDNSSVIADLAIKFFFTVKERKRAISILWQFLPVRLVILFYAVLRIQNDLNGSDPKILQKNVVYIKGHQLNFSSVRNYRTTMLSTPNLATFDYKIK
jgi:hypothetical protein